MELDRIFKLGNTRIKVSFDDFTMYLIVRKKEYHSLLIVRTK